MKRCGWAKTELSIAYHDKEWGVPRHDDRTLFEFLILEGAQAGLSWETILRKRENYREAFDNFDVRLVASYTRSKIKELLANPGIVRNRLKINAAIQNARAFVALQEEFGSFDAYVWGFVNGRPVRNAWKSPHVPAHTRESDAMSEDLTRRGFRFAGPKICYPFMQAVGMVNDHEKDCFRYKEIGENHFDTFPGEFARRSREGIFARKYGIYSYNQGVLQANGRTMKLSADRTSQ